MQIPIGEKTRFNRFFRVCEMFGAIQRTDMNGTLPWDEARLEKTVKKRLMILMTKRILCEYLTTQIYVFSVIELIF